MTLRTDSLAHEMRDLEPFWLPFPNPKEIAEFKVLYKKLFDKTLTDEEASDVATRLVHIHYVFYCATHGPVKDEDELTRSTDATNQTRAFQK